MRNSVREFLTRKEAADYLTERWLKISVSSLNKYASSGEGPIYTNRGKSGGEAMYSRTALDTWASTFFTKPASRSTKRVKAVA